MCRARDFGPEGLPGEGVEGVLCIGTDVDPIGVLIEERSGPKDGELRTAGHANSKRKLVWEEMLLGSWCCRSVSSMDYGSVTMKI